MLQRSAVAECALAGTLDDRTVCNRIAEGHAQFDHAGARINGGQSDLAAGRKIGIAAGDVGDKSGTSLERDGHPDAVILNPTSDSPSKCRCLCRRVRKYSRSPPLTFSSLERVS